MGLVGNSAEKTFCPIDWARLNCTMNSAVARFQLYKKHILWASLKQDWKPVLIMVCQQYKLEF